MPPLQLQGEILTQLNNTHFFDVPIYEHLINACNLPSFPHKVQIA